MKIDVPVLKLLGPVPFWRGEQKCLDALEAIYRKAMTRAAQAPALRHKTDKKGAAKTR